MLRARKTGEQAMIETLRAIDTRQWMLVGIALALAAASSTTGMVFGYSIREISAYFGEAEFGAAALLGARGMGGLPGLIFGIVFALFADRFGRKNWLAALAVISGGAIIAISLVQSLKLAIGFALLSGFTEGLLFALIIGMICESGNARGRYGATLLASSSLILIALLGLGMSSLHGAVGWQTQLQVIGAITIVAGLVPMALPSAAVDGDAPQIKTSLIARKLLSAIGPVGLIAIALIVLAALSSGERAWSSVMIQQAGLAAGGATDQPSTVMGWRSLASALGMAAMIGFLLTRPASRILAIIGLFSALVLVANLAGMGVWTHWPHSLIIAKEVISGAAIPGVFALSFAALTSFVSPLAMTTAIYITSTLSRTFSALGTAAIGMVMAGQPEMSSKLITLSLAIGIPAALIFGMALNRYAFRWPDEDFEAGETVRFS
jgi:MFS family permease